MSTKIEAMQGRIQRIKEDLLELGEMRPGTLSKQYNVCGKKGCRCKDARNPQKHGPYYQLSFSHKGRSRTQFVKKQALGEVRFQLKNYATFRKLTETWVALSIELAAAKSKRGS